MLTTYWLGLAWLLLAALSPSRLLAQSDAGPPSSASAAPAPAGTPPILLDAATHLYANQGVVDETFTLTASEGQEVSIALGDARGDGRAGEMTLPLRLVPDAIQALPAAEAFKAGQHTLKAKIGSDKRLRFRVVGLSFDRPMKSTSALVVEPGGQKVPLEFSPNVAAVGLGLHAAEWRDSRVVVPFEHQPLSTCIDTDLPARQPVRFVIEPPEQPKENSLRICPGKVDVVAADVAGKTGAKAECNGVLVTAKDLSYGLYEGILNIEGQRMAFGLSLRPAPITQFFAILLGASLSASFRAIATFYLRKARNEATITELAGKVRPCAVVWDGLAIGNALRRSRADNTMLRLESLEASLKVVTDGPPRRPEVDTIVAALDLAPLPAMIRSAINLELSHLQRLSSVADLSEINRGLTRLALAAGDGFRSRFRNWLRALRVTFDRRRPPLEAKFASVEESLRAQISGGVRNSGASLERRRGGVCAVAG